jgi:hypothetical protein
VSLAVALERAETFVRRFMVMGEHDVVAVTLWAAHTWAVDALWTTPYLHVTSGEYGSGKTRLMNDVLASLVRKPFMIADVSQASLYRTLDAERPTALIDEVDALFGEKRQNDKAEAIRAILNAGYRRRGSDVTRWDVTTRGNETFNVFGPKALAGTGDLPRSIATRAIRIRLKKRLVSETVAEWVDHEDRSTNEAGPIREAFARLAGLVEAQLRLGRPRMPPGVRDRDADIWAPLLAVADAAGGAWPDRARAAAVALISNAVAEDPSEGIRLLSDLRDVLRELGWPQVLTVTILEPLVAIEDAPWAHFCGREPLNPTGLARILRRYDVKPRTVRAAEGRGKGYFLEHLEDAFARYLPQSSGDGRDKSHSYAEKTGLRTRDMTPNVTGSEGASNPHGYEDVTAGTPKAGVEACASGLIGISDEGFEDLG